MHGQSLFGLSVQSFMHWQFQLERDSMQSWAGWNSSFICFCMRFYGLPGVLAFGEAGNFPAAIKATAEYFPKKERSFATGFLIQELM